MNFLNNLLDSLIGFVRRNPILVTVILILAFTAPTVLRGLATLILYIILGFMILIVVLMLMLRWRIYKVQQQVREQFGQQQAHNGFNPFGGQRQNTRQQPTEGEVKVHTTTAKPEKKIADNVGDYVDFEETKNN